MPFKDYIAYLGSTTITVVGAAPMNVTPMAGAAMTTIRMVIKPAIGNATIGGTGIPTSNGMIFGASMVLKMVGSPDFWLSSGTSSVFSVTWGKQLI